jgi:outer membrane protein
MGCAFLCKIDDRFVALALSLSLMVAAPVYAAGPVSWVVGAGAGARPDYEGSEDYHAVPIGYLRASWGRHLFVELAGAHGSGGAPRLRMNVVADGFLKFGPLLQYRIGRGDVENSSVDALPNIDGTVELGGFFGFEQSGWEGAISFAQDVGGEHNGYVIELNAGYTAALLDGLKLKTLVATSLGSHGYIGTYFTVDTDDAPKAGLLPYDADGGMRDVGTELQLTWTIPGTSHWSLGAVASYFRLLGDAADSPIVDDVGDANQFFGGMMVLFEN